MASSPTQEQASFLDLLCMTDDDEAAAASASFLKSCSESDDPSPVMTNRPFRPPNGFTISREKLGPEELMYVQGHTFTFPEDHAAHAGMSDITGDIDGGDDQSLQDAFMQAQLQSNDSLTAHHRAYLDYTQSQLQRAADHCRDYQQQELQRYGRLDAGYDKSFDLDHIIQANVELNRAGAAENRSQNSGVTEPPSTSRSRADEPPIPANVEPPQPSTGGTSSIDERHPSLKKAKKASQPCVSLKTRSETDILDDGYKWRKYGQKAVKRNTFPRSYYRCTYNNCNVKKRVERCLEDPGIVVTTYQGIHTHPCQQQQQQQEERTLCSFHPSMQIHTHTLSSNEGDTNMEPAFILRSSPPQLDLHF